MDECYGPPRRSPVLGHREDEPPVLSAVSGIPESAWIPIHYPNAIWDQDEQRFISDAQVAEVRFTAFTSRRQADHISGRLIVRRVNRLTPTSVPGRAG